MKAAIYYGPEDIRCSTIPDPILKDDHAMLVTVSATSICGSDLHLYRGALDPIMARGESQTGHELIGQVAQVGKDVGRFKPGDRVSVAYSISCGDCYCCKVGQTAHCETTQKAVYGFGTGFGGMNGTHAEALLVPYADGHAMRVPDQISDTEAVTLSCNLPTALIANKLADIQPGENCAVVGYGPTGMMCVDIARTRSPGKLVVFDTVEHRLNLAEKKGAIPIDAAQEDAVERGLTLTGGRGFDKIIEVVGSPEALAMSLKMVRAGGTVAAVGVFTANEFNLDLSDVFLRNISLHMNGFANVQPFMWHALRLLDRGLIDAPSYFSHEFRLDEIDAAFSCFNQKIDGANKILIRP